MVHSNGVSLFAYILCSFTKPKIFIGRGFKKRSKKYINITRRAGTDLIFN